MTRSNPEARLQISVKRRRGEKAGVYTYWTPERDGELMGYREQRVRMRIIAERMGVTFSAIANRTNKLLAAGAIVPLEGVKRGFVDPVAQFWSLVDKTAGEEGCWIWTGKVCNTGRGNVGFEIGEFSPNALTHRVAYHLHYGALPPKPLILRHTCDNGICCNPKHLTPGTYRDNAHDCIERGRAPWQKRRAA